MRVTNFMTHNKSLNNINRNMRHLQRIYEQTTSTKQISRPSQDPLIASRSLRFRTRLSNNAQHQQNVESGHAWMNVTEAAFFNLLRGNDSVLTSIKDELLRMSNNPTATLDDLLVLASNMANYKEQLGQEMNQTISGRFVFAGWRTEQPPVLNAHRNGVSYVVTQVFNIRDIEQTYPFQRFPPGDDNIVNDPYGVPVVRPPINILKLPFRARENPGSLPTGITFGTAGVVGESSASPTPVIGTHTPGAAPVPGTPSLGIFRPDGTPFNIVRMSLNDLEDDVRINAFIPPDDGNTIHYIPETGELVFGDRVRLAFEDGTTVTYEVSNLQRGDLNPLVYFDTHAELTRFNDLNRFPVQGHLPLDPALDDPWPIPIVFPISMSGPAPAPTGTPLNLPGPFVMEQTLSASAGRARLAYGNIVPGSMSFTIPNPANPPVPPNIDPGFNVTMVSTFTGDPATLADNEVVFDQNTGMLHMNATTSAAFRNVTITFSKNEFSAADTIPTANPSVTVTAPLMPPNGEPLHFVGHFEMEPQPIYYEFSHGSPVQVNSLAREVITDKLFADLRRLIDFINELTPPDRRELEEVFTAAGVSPENLESRVTEHMGFEYAEIRRITNNRINNMLRLIDDHKLDAAREHTDLGNRMRRVEMFEMRLEQNEGNYTQLKSENEDVDMTWALIQQAIAEAAFQGALRIMATSVQLSLVQFV